LRKGEKKPNLSRLANVTLFCPGENIYMPGKRDTFITGVGLRVSAVKKPHLSKYPLPITRPNLLPAELWGKEARGGRNTRDPRGERKTQK